MSKPMRIRGSAGDGPHDDYEDYLAQLVAGLHRYNIRDAAVLAAMQRVRRHVYIPEGAEVSLARAYGDHPCPIGFGQTISQPFIVAYMTERMQLEPGEKVLEIGTGSGYQAAVLAELGMDVYTVEAVPELADHARRVLKQEGYVRVQVHCGDGYEGWPEHAPYDGIIVTCAPKRLPRKLAEQMTDGGRMILPLGVIEQQLVMLRNTNGHLRRERDLRVRFVPMVKSKQES